MSNWNSVHHLFFSHFLRDQTSSKWQSTVGYTAITTVLQSDLKILKEKKSTQNIHSAAGRISVISVTIEFSMLTQENWKLIWGERDIEPTNLKSPEPRSCSSVHRDSVDWSVCRRRLDSTVASAEETESGLWRACGLGLRFHASLSYRGLIGWNIVTCVFKCGSSATRRSRRTCTVRLLTM